MNEALRVQRRFRFVRSEEEALRLDEESEDDVLVLPARLDLLEFLEDELILALPIVPRHDACPSPLPLAALTSQEAPAPNPFAALAALRGQNGAKVAEGDGPLTLMACARHAHADFAGAILAGFAKADCG